VLLSWFGCGLAPWAPGTVGSLGGLPLGIAIDWAFGGAALAVAAALLFALGWAVAHVHLQDGADSGDPQWIVVDEVVGQWLALAAVPLHPLAVLLAFGLFRLFDIAKPWPVSWADREVGGALGIMLDDLLAGLYAAVVGFGTVSGFRIVWTGLS
jgi:phosphatidylglycerophosphatase A